MKFLSVWDWLFFAYMAGCSLVCWLFVWIYCAVIPGGWPMGLVALFGAVIVSIATGVLFWATIDYKVSMDRIDKERKRNYG